MRFIRACCAALALLAFVTPVSSAPIHTSYLWHMHQPIYWPERSTWNPQRYETVYETIILGHSANDEFSIFNSDDRVHDYQDYPRTALQSVLDLPDAGAQVSFAGSLIENIQSLASAGWNGGRYGSNWFQSYRDAMAWTTSGGRRRLDAVNVGAHHVINPLADESVFRRELQVHKALAAGAWGAGHSSNGFFPAEMCFSERLIPTLLAEGIQWSVVPDVHLSRACADYPYQAQQDQCDPPNRADQINPAQGEYQSLSISRGVTTKVPAPYGFRPHYAQQVDPATGQVHRLIVVPAANGMSWNEGYGLYGTGEIDAIAARNDPTKPMLVLFAHDGDNAWSGGYSYFNENVTQFSHAAASKGYEPTTIDEFLADHPVAPDDIVHIEDGGWVNADGDFGSPQFINWNWPLVNAAGQFDIAAGWAEDERNWALLTAATNRVLTAEGIAGAPNVDRIATPTMPGTTPLERAWHFLLAGHESGYMYYGAEGDMEVKATLACNRAVEYADVVIASGADTTAPTLWLPQRLPWNPGGKGGGALWGWPGGAGANMTQDFWVWTFAYDVSGMDTCRLVYRFDADGQNPLGSIQNDTYAGGAEVGPWQSAAMSRRQFPTGNVFNRADIDFTVLPNVMAEQWSAHVSGITNQLVDYYVEGRDRTGRIRRSPIQHVYVGDGSGGGTTNPAVAWEPAAPLAGGTLTIHYDAVPGTLPDATSLVRIHVGHSGWNNVLVPDPAMTWNAATNRFDYVYAIPSNATSVDFVFNNGGGTWDNNGGADWHVPVSGGSAPPHTIDGTLDAGVPLVASCGGLDLHADYDGRWLYVAAPKAGNSLDHFAFVSRPDSARMRSAPWSKAGQVAAYDLMLGNESVNGWAGGFRADGSQPTAGLVTSSGAVLEARFDLATLLGTAPPVVTLALGAFGTSDGGVLTLQAACGDGDGALEPAERVHLYSTEVLAAQGPVAGRPLGLRLLSANPSRGLLRARIDAQAGEALTVDVLDLRGARVMRLHEGVVSGPVEVTGRLGGAARLSAGVYFLTARSGARTATQRLVHTP